MAKPTKITNFQVRDIRFPTTLHGDGSDAVNDPDYSCAYVKLETDSDFCGYGLTFTCGNGTHIVCEAVRSLGVFVVGRKLDEIYSDFGSYWNQLVQEPQLRWLGPEKGVTHLAVAAIINALWDLWSRIEQKPLWKLLVDMEPEQLVSCLPFNYITDALTPDEALAILKEGQDGKAERVKQIENEGYPAYTTSAGWLGYSDQKIEMLCREALEAGFTRFKVKVGKSKEDDDRRIAQVRKQVGDDNMVMVDANQKWDVQEAIDWMIPLAKYNLTWIEEPTSPDDIIGHAKIAKALAPYGIGVATGEACQNRVMFKQFLQAEAFSFCQVDSCRLGGPNEIITVYLMAKKFGIPVCPHAGGVGLCELVQHLQMFDYCVVSKSKKNRVIEYVDHLHEHFMNPVIMKSGSYQAPAAPGYSSEMVETSLAAYEYPNGSAWEQLFLEGKFERPKNI